MTAAAAFFDLQVNGYGGVDFNQDALDAEQLHRACERLEADGVAGLLATIITDDLAAMCHRLSRLAELREAEGPTPSSAARSALLDDGESPTAETVEVAATSTDDPVSPQRTDEGKS